MQAIATHRRDIFLLTLLLGTTAIAFAPALQCGLTLVDDAAVVHQPHVNTGLSIANVRWAFTTFELGYPLPIPLVSFMVDDQLFGLSAAAFHAENVAWHMANVALLYLLLRRLTGSRWRSAAVAVLFAVHPLRAESVAWVTERKDVLGAFFGLLALHAYVSFARRPGVWAYLLVLVLLEMSLLCKPMLVMLPILLLALDYWPLGRIGSGVSPRRLLLEKGPLALLAVVCVAVGMRGQTVVAAVRNVRSTQFPPGTLIANALISYPRYVGKMFWFRHLAFGYPLVPPWPAWEVIAAVLFLVAVSVWTCTQARTRPWLAVGWIWYTILLLPAAGFYVLGDFSIADRYTYFPTIGLLVMIIWSLPNRLGRAATATVAAAVVGGLVVATRAQVLTWRDNLTLFQHSMQAVGPSDANCASLGFSLSEAHRYAEAIPFYDQAITLNPADIPAHVNEGLALDQLGDYQAAISHYKIVIAANPDDTQASYNLGTDLLTLGRPGDAVGYLRRAANTKAPSVEVMTNLAAALLRSGDLKGAIDESQRTLAINPKATNARLTLAEALAASGQRDQAKAQYEVAILDDPHSSVAYNDLGAFCLGSHDVAYAIFCFKQALNLDPRMAGAHNNLGVALEQCGQTHEAAAEFRKAIEIDPKNEDARRNLERLRPAPR